jgi:DNA-binding NarL/FixJ family response regulator
VGIDDVARLTAGQEALKGGAWETARETFQTLLAVEETPEALFGLGTALWWLGDMRGTMDHLERAYAGFRRGGDAMYAAACALRLGFHCRAHLANHAAAAGWLARGARLVEEHALDALRGELVLMRAYLEDDPEISERHAQEAIAIGRRMADLDLELCGMSQLGAALVAQGRIERGVALLDEAMAGCLGGEPGSFDTVAFTGCTTMVACARCADFERAMQWVRATERFAARHGAPFLAAECRLIYARVLFARGELGPAEDAAKATIEACRGEVRSYHGEALAMLAEIRLAQGRIEEAERLLRGFEGEPSLVPVLARLQIARGKPELAAATVERRVDVATGDAIERALLLEILGEAEVASGQHEAAAQRGLALVEIGERLGCRLILARGHRLRGYALSHDDPTAARRHLDIALDTFVQMEMAYEAASTCLRLAHALAAAQPEIAVEEARRALAAFEEMAAGGRADAAAALLRRLGVKAARLGPRAHETLTKREHEVLALLGEGLSNPEIAKRLFVSRKTVEHHVAHVLEKLGLRSRAEAAAEAVRRCGSNPPPK